MQLRKSLQYLTLIIPLPLLLTSCWQNKKTMEQTTTHAIRLLPGKDVKKEIQSFVEKNHIKAGWIATCVGSLTHYQIRFANQNKGFSDSGHFEIVALSGTLSENGSNLHIAVSDSTGKTIGGHLMENCIVYTTAEIIIQESKKHVFKREKDGSTPWEELQIEVLKQ